MRKYTCPICESTSYLHDVVDFNKCCEERKGKFLPKSGEAVYYACCTNCSFLFAPDMIAWTKDEFAEKIYNKEYIDVDPDYQEIRPNSNFQLLLSKFHDNVHLIRHLDYGGGNGFLSDRLKGVGWNTESYDPFATGCGKPLNNVSFNFITAFEVFEHVPQPKELLMSLSQFIENDGLIFFSTLLSDGNVCKTNRLDWWYASPRNGHICLFSAKSLKVLGEVFGYHFGSLGVGYHVYFRVFPSWAKSLLQQ